MSLVKVDSTYLSGIANAIRSKNGSSDTYTPGEMADAIDDIETGGGSSGSANNIICRSVAYIDTANDGSSGSTPSIYITPGTLSTVAQKYVLIVVMHRSDIISFPNDWNELDRDNSDGNVGSSQKISIFKYYVPQNVPSSNQTITFASSGRVSISVWAFDTNITLNYVGYRVVNTIPNSISIQLSEPSLIVYNNAISYSGGPYRYLPSVSGDFSICRPSGASYALRHFSAVAINPCQTSTLGVQDFQYYGNIDTGTEVISTTSAYLIYSISQVT